MKTVLVPFNDNLFYRPLKYAPSCFKSVLLLQMFLLLPQREFAIIYFCIIQRRTLRNVGASLSISFPKVRMIKLRAMERLKKLIIKYLDSDVDKLMGMIKSVED